jgi:hypothetical protein
MRVIQTVILALAIVVLIAGGVTLATETASTSPLWCQGPLCDEQPCNTMCKSQFEITFERMIQDHEDR